MEYWKTKADQFTERCDFRGLPLKSATQDMLVNGGGESEGCCWKEKVVPYGYRNSILNGSTFKSISSSMTSKFPMRLPALINLAWHRTLSVYGNGAHTITLTSLKVEGQHKLIPVIVDHSEFSGKKISEILKGIEMDMGSTLENYLTLEGSFGVPEPFFDSLIILSGETKDDPQIVGVPLTLTIGEKNGAFDIRLSYNTKLFDVRLIDGVMDYFKTVVEKLVEDDGAVQDLLMSEVEFLPSEMKRQIENWNDQTTGPFPEDKRLHHLVEEAAAATPDKTAVICGNTGVEVTYRELNDRANQVAHFLHSKEEDFGLGVVEPEQFIALFLDKTEILLMTILGIWKSGAAHIPIDPQYPDERVKFILEDTRAKILIANEKYLERLNRIFYQEDKLIISVEGLLKMAAQGPKNNLELSLRSDQLAYVTYTSGTTGVPKGVYKEHKGVVNSITDLTNRYDMLEAASEVVVLFSAYVWEPFIRQTLITLVNSQLLVIVDDSEKLDPLKFINFLNKHGVTYLNGTGSVLQEYELEKCPSLRKLILVGEELTPRRYDQLREKFKGRIICEYGFTESALVTCLNVFEIGDRRRDRSIGRPLRNVKAYVVDGDLRRMPVGAVGELYIGGVGISRGYLNREELTRERFLQNPFQTEEEKVKGWNSLIYRTGDLARWLEHDGVGVIEYVGRNDFQVKLRGTRIEPAEIESVVLQYPNVRKCIVAVKDSKIPEESTASSRHLVGYFVATGNIDEEELIGYLEGILPRYMIPARMLQVEEIRTNINGKVDLAALPEVELFLRESNKALGKEVPLLRARNEVDRKLVKIWSDALTIPEDGIGIRDDFFRLGGHSITCIQLVGRIRQQLECEVRIDKIFSLRTIERLSDFIISSHGAIETSKKVVVVTQPGQLGKNEEILANSLQQGLVYHYLKQGKDDDAYIMQSHFRYSQPLHVEAYKKAWELAQRKYPSLRLFFKVEKEVYQIFKSEETSKLDWTFSDICHVEDKGMELQKIIDGDRARRYNLEEGPLFRIYLVKEDDSSYSTVFSYHHVIIDGWSLPILFRFVHGTYKKILEGEGMRLRHEVEHDEDMGYYLSQKYFEAHRKDHLDYWRKEVEQVELRVNLSGLVKPEVKYKIQLNTYDKIEEQRQHIQMMDSGLLRKLHNFGVTHGVTLHSILQFAWHKVLHTYGGGSHTIVGTTVSGRNVPVDGVEHSVGLFINTLPLVVDHHLKKKEEEDDGWSVLQAIQEIQGKVNGMNDKSSVELGKLGGELKHSLFDSLFVLEPDMDFGDFLGFKMVGDYEKLDYPLAVIAREEQGGLKFALCYAGELFQEEVIRDALELLEYFLVQVVTLEPSSPVKSMELVLPKQLLLMEGWNNRTRKPYAEDKTLHQVFEEAAILNPRKVALVFEDKKWTYRELNGRANQLARHLRSLVTLEPDDKVALILDKNDLLILAILGVWKSGGAFVPIDPGYPEERIQFMLEDTQAKLVIINGKGEGRLQEILKKMKGSSSIKALQIEDFLSYKSNHGDQDNLPSLSKSTDLCYVIYTSGTTGQPKGVMTEHRGVVNLHDSLAKIFDLKSESKSEVILSFSNFVFDHFVEQMTDALLSGQTLVILNDEMRTDKERLYRYIRDNGVTYLSGTPSVLSLYEYGAMDSITRIDAVGEDFTEAYFNKIRSTFRSGLIINGYGPTETSITTHKRIYREGEGRTDKSIGHQIYNSACYILNSNGKRIPIGAVGELHLGGVGIGRGYLNREDLTAKGFLENPFATEEDRREGRNLRVYRTGDLARFFGNGEVECLGRNDFQVKVRGLRIELSEIEAAILSHPEVSHCVVVSQSRGGGDKATSGSSNNASFLVGYYVSANKGQSEKMLLGFIQSKLPSFMMPNRLVHVDNIPVTINGKCDTKRLPKVEFIKGHNNLILDDLVNLTEVELRLRFIWSELLDLPVESIGLEDDFFSLGGDSLLVTSMSFMITQAFGKVVGVPEVFLHKTIRALGHLISQMGGGAGYHQEQIDKVESHFAPASMAQERLLFIDEMEGGTSAFNVPFRFKLKEADYVKQEMVIESLKLVAQRHQALHTLLVKFEDGLYQQKILTDEEFQLLWPRAVQMKEVVSNDEVNKVIQLSENYIFKLDQELPFRATFVRDLRENMESFISVVFHHTCFDGWSLPIFHREWLSFYRGGADKVGFPKLDYHYKEFSNLQRSLLTGPNLDKLSSYWIDKLSNVEQLNLATDFERPSKFDYAGFEVCRSLDHEMTTALRDLGKEMKTSLFSILASAFALTLSVYSGQEEILIGAPISNRLRSEFKDVVGFFINILPLKFSVNQAEMTMEDFIKSVGAEVVTSHVNQDMPFDRLVKDLKIDKDLSRHPLVQVMLNFNPLAGGPLNKKYDDDADEGHLAPFQFLEGDEEGDKDTTSKYDLSLTVTEKEAGGLLINLTYAKSLFSKSSVEGYLDSFLHFLSTFSQPGTHKMKLNELDLGGPSSQLPPALTANGSSSRVHDLDCSSSTLPEIFEKIAAQCGAQTALIYQDKHITYDELNTRSSQLAGLLLQTKASGSDQRVVALVMNKSDWMITAILGIWKAGAAYVPVDPAYPPERIRFILKDTGTKLILSDEANANRMRQVLQEDNKADFEILTVDSSKAIQQMESFPPSAGLDYGNNLQGNDLCYVIYTSGSTGHPKGVMITHNNVLSFRDSLLLHHKKHERVLFLSNFVFDFSIEQLLLSIFNWGSLIIPGDKDFVIDDQLYSHLNQAGLTYLSGTPSVITALDLKNLPHLGTVTVAGEKFKLGHFTKIRSQFGGRLLNAYGVTETTVYNSISEFPPGDNKFRNSLGRFLPNTGFHLLDKYLRPSPHGAVAELYLSGACVSRGYLNLEEMNGRHFLPNPYSFDLDEHSVLYKTGDLVRWNNSSGELEYLHRNDHQVKIRGFRIELQEVEAAILRHEKISQCAVIQVEEDSSLVGIFLGGSQLAPDELKSFLEKSLPPHMIPSGLIQYDGESLPVTLNGKLDGKALGRFYRSKWSSSGTAAAATSHSAPRSQVELALCKIFGSVLGIPMEEIGVDEDFFRLGGDSISSLLLAGKIRNQLGANCITVKDVFDQRTVRGLCSILKCNDNIIMESDDEPKQSRPTGDVPLLPIQEWFFAKNLKWPGRYNQTFGIRVPQQLDIQKLRASLRTLISHHDAFHLRFSHSPEGYPQHYEEDALDELNFHHLDLAGLDQAEIEGRLDGWSSTFDLANGPLYSVVYLEDKASASFKIWWSIHHLIVDSVSWRIIKDDLETLYHHHQGGRLPWRGTSYKEFSVDLRNRHFLPEKAYWDPIVEEVPSYNAKLLGGINGNLEGSHFEFGLDGERTRRLFSGIQDNLLTAVACALARLTGSPTNYVTLEGHGREGQGDLSNTVGWFTTMYPVKLQACPERDIHSNIQNVKGSLRSIPNKGIGYGALFGYVGRPLPCVTFNFLGSFGTAAATTKNGGGEEEWSLDLESSLGLQQSDSEEKQISRNTTAIDITAMCDQGRLKFSMEFHLKPEVSRKFVDSFQNSLERISQSMEAIEKPLPFGDYDAYFEFPPTSSSDLTLFILPPGEGGAESYFNNLVPSLNKDFHLVVFNNYYLDRGLPTTTFEELASMYLTYVTRIQPNGPYNLLGWSFGGVLALEMSRQLTSAGASVQNLFLIDSYLNVGKALKDLNLPEDSSSKVIDGINHRYKPSRSDFEGMCGKIGDITLFKAELPNDMAKSEEQHRLYEYFRHGPFNNLDTWIPSQLINVKEMKGQSHTSWAKDAEQVKNISSVIRDNMKKKVHG